MDFIFPLTTIESVSTFEELKRLVNASLSFENLSSYCQYKFQMINGLYIYCRCRNCPARLVYKKNNDKFFLYKANIRH